MTFPVSPGDGQEYTNGRTIWRYSAAEDKWQIVAGSIVERPMNVSGGYVERSGTNLLFAPDVSNLVALYQGGYWTPNVIPDAGITVACTGLSNDTDYYLYVYDNAGTLTLDLSTTAPTTQNGIQVKTGATDRLLIARCRSNGSGAITTYVEDAATQLVSNVYNKRKIGLYKQDSTDSWTYSTATWRAANNSNANRVEFVSDGKNATVGSVKGLAYTSTVSTRTCSIGIAIDATNTNDAKYYGMFIPQQGGNLIAKYNGVLSAGYHYLQWVEYGAGADIQTWPGDHGNNTSVQSGIMAEIMA